jgi:succinate dehydrogenase / fumarate reductase, cytochrome b subunit
MAASKKRPVYLNLVKIRLPVAGVVSILHRVSGVLLVLLLPVLLYFFDLSLTNPETFAACRGLLSGWFGKLLILGVVWLFVQHFYSGIRHLLLDLDIWVTREHARATAWAAFAIALATVAMLDVLV